MILLDQREGEVDRRGHAGRAEHWPIPHEDGIGLDPYVGIGGSKPFRVFPMGRDPAPGQQSRMGQQEGAGAGRAEAARQPRLLLQPAGDLLAWVGRDAVWPDHDQRVGRFACLVHAHVGDEGHPGGAFHRGAPLGHQLNPIGLCDAQFAVRLEQGVLDAGNLEQVHIAGSEDRDEHGRTSTGRE